MRTIEQLSPPSPVSMGEEWFKIATRSHFWIRRRFDVITKLAGRELAQANTILDIGSGSCILAAMLAGLYQTKVDGVDLNSQALAASGSEANRLLCYDIHDRQVSLSSAYDMVALLDVIEHVEDDTRFVDSAAFHLKKGGCLLINVPALKQWHSRYDDAVGHLRRYDMQMIARLAKETNLSVVSWTYWAFPLLPLLVLRPPLLKTSSQQQILPRGFNPAGRFMNFLLYLICQLEYLPQHVTGASLMVLLKK